MKVVRLAEKLTPIALIGAGGIGKTSIALTVLHDDRIKQRFGDRRWFIRCDQLSASHDHLLSQLSEVTGAGVSNPVDLAPLRHFLSSRKMIIVLDNAESILDPKGTGAQEIYAVVEELSRFNNICLCITSRITTIPPNCEIFDVPTLPTEAARDAFYHIYKNDRQSNRVDNILKQLDFHPLSITLLATVAHQNRWDNKQLVKEWERQRTGVLRTEHDWSLATTIELSLASPMFRELGPNARDLLGVVSFFPQGINENHISWLFPKKDFSQLFPTHARRKDVFNKLCILSLTYRSNGFITMLAPLRDYLRPQNPASSPLLHLTKECYFSWLSVDVRPGHPGFEDASWITLEDVNVEHLLDVFMTIDTNSNDVWDVCYHFMEHLLWHKKRLVMVGPKIEALSDDHHSKPQCLFKLSQLFNSIGNDTERKRLLLHTLKIWRERGDSFEVANTLGFLSDANRFLELYEEGIGQAREALGIYERCNHKLGQAKSWDYLAWLLFDNKQLDAAEEAASRAINLFSDEGDQFRVCSCRRLLGNIYRNKGEMGKAINHFETALGIASPLNWHDEQFWIHFSLVELFLDENQFNAAHAHAELAKSHTINDPYHLGCAVKLRAKILYKEYKFGEAQSEALRAADVFEKFGAASDLEDCRELLRYIEAGVGMSATSGQSDFNGELLEIAPPASVNPPPSAYGGGHPSANFEQLAPHLYEYPIPDHRAHHYYHPLSPQDIFYRTGQPPVTAHHSAFPSTTTRR